MCLYVLSAAGGRQQASGRAAAILTSVLSIFQTRMETTFGPAYSAVTTITKGECVSRVELLPKALCVIPARFRGGCFRNREAVG